MVGYGDGSVTPFYRPLDELLGGGHAVHGGHIGMHMQLNALLGGVVADLDAVDKHNGIRLNAV